MDKKKRMSIIAIYALILVVFNVLYFVIPFPKAASAWVCYGFSTFAIIAGCFITLLAFARNDSLKSKVYSYPIFNAGKIYLIAQLSFSLTVFIIGCFANIPAWIPIAVSCVDIVYVVISVIVAENAKDIAVQQEAEVARATAAIKYFRVDAYHIADKCKDAELKNIVNKFAEQLKYSDPVSNPELEAVEEDIKQELGALEILVVSDEAAAKEKVEQLTIMLNDRNRRCKMLKHH